MANYNEQTGQGQYWQRCNSVLITNPLGGTAEATFYEEVVVNLDTKVVRQSVDVCKAQFNPAATVPLLDPNTNLPTGTEFTHGELYQMLYSLYIQTATQRDQQQ